MYSLAAYSDPLMKVKPADVMYELPSYAATYRSVEEMDNKESRSEGTEEKVAKMQLQLISEISDFVDRLSKALSKLPFSSTHNRSAEKSRVALSEMHKSSLLLNDVPFFYVQEPLKMHNLGQTICACASPEFADFPVASYPENVIVTASEKDFLWIIILANVGAKRGIQFEGDEFNFPTCKRTTLCSVSVHKDDSKDMAITRARISDVEVQGCLQVCKLLGALVGVYPSSGRYPTLAAHIDMWMLLSVNLIEGYESLSSMFHRMNSALHKQDFLTSYVATAADLLAFAAWDHEKSTTCNIELWVNRMQQLCYNSL